MTALRHLFEATFLRLLRAWTLRQALLVAVCTVALGVLAQGRLLPDVVVVVALAVIGLLLTANLAAEWFVERGRHLSRVFLANVILYLLAVAYVARAIQTGQ